MTAPLTGGRLADLLGVRHPIVLGPLGGGFSCVALTSAVSAGGGLGSYGANNLTADRITEVVAELAAAGPEPFAVNLWVPHPQDATGPLDPAEFARHVDRLAPLYAELDLFPPRTQPTPAATFDDQVDALLAAGPPVISFIMGPPPRRVLDQARRAGIVTMATATTVAEAVALEQAGLDVVIASGSDAGGHRGSWLRPATESLVGTFSLVPQVADAVSVPVVAAGGITDPRGVAAALVLGADGVQVGTGFLATDESIASREHKAALHSDEARATMLTRVFSGRLARAIPNRFLRALADAEADVPPYPVQGGLTAALRRAATERGLPDYVNLWAGQAAPLARRIGAREYLESLVTGAERVLARRD